VTAITLELAAFLLTYLLHSTFLLLMAASLGRKLSLPAAERAWRLALFGGLFTAGLQLGLDWSPLAGRLHLAVGPAPRSEAIRVAELAGGAAPSVQPAPLVQAEALEAPAAVLIDEPLRPAATASWPSWLAGLWLVGAAAGSIHLARAYRRLRALLRDRAEIREGGLLLQLRLLLFDSPLRAVRISQTAKLRVPIARGIARPEICLPDWVERDLMPPQQSCLLAHELAHLERRDPLWLLLYRLVETVLFVQPLNRWARRRLQQIAEYRCDDRAVEHTGHRLALARCLTEVGQLTLAERQRLPAYAMAEQSSELARRVRRLLSTRWTPARSPAWLLPGAIMILIALFTVAPRIAGQGPDSSAPAESAEPTEDLELLQPPAVSAPPPAPAPPEPAEAPAPPEAGEPPEASDCAHRWPRHELHAALSEAHGVIAEVVENVLEDVMDAAHDSLEQALEPLDQLDDEVSDEIDAAFDAEFDGQLELMEQQLEGELEAIGDELERSLESLEGQLDPPELERLEDELDNVLEQVERSVERALERAAARRERSISEAKRSELRRIAGAHRQRIELDGQALRHQARAKLQAAARELAQIRRQIHEQACTGQLDHAQLKTARALAYELAERLRDVDFRELHAQAAGLALALRPGHDEIVRLAQQAARAAGQVRSSEEEIARLRETARHALEQARAQIEARLAAAGSR
jgi:beta-lactamase regulating signal transducer with metallopeptidase domain